MATSLARAQVQRANQLERSVHQSVQVDEVPLIKLFIQTQLSPIVLVQSFHVLGDILGIEDPYQTFVRLCSLNTHADMATLTCVDIKFICGSSLQILRLCVRLLLWIFLIETRCVIVDSFSPLQFPLHFELYKISSFN